MDQINKLFTGGQCDSTLQGNAFVNFAGGLFFKDHPAALRSMPGGQALSEKELEQRALQMRIANQLFKQAEGQHGMDHLQMGRLFKEQQVRAEMQQKLMLEQMWRQQMSKREQMEASWGEAQLRAQSDRLLQEAEMKQAYDKYMAQKEQQQRIAHASTSIFETMMQDQDPRFKNSQFLAFVQKINTGEVVIKGKQITQTGKIKTTMESMWKDSEKLVEQQAAEKQTIYSESQSGVQKAIQEYQAAWNQRLQQYANLAESADFQKELTERYMQSLKKGDIDLVDVWQKSSDLQEQQLYRDISQHYEMATDNQFSASERALQTGLDLLANGNIQHGVLALQAHLTKHPQDATAWRVLGKIMQEQNQEQRACSCFLKCFRLNPHDQQNLKLLAISCTNVFDDLKALVFLQQWLNNSRYKGPQVAGIELLEVKDINMDTLKNMIFRMVQLFQGIVQQHPDDPNLLINMATLAFISRNYSRAADLFTRLSVLQPGNYDIWNKLGATLAHLGEADAAIECYHKALSLNPAYVKAWANLSIAYSFRNQHHQAAQLLLNSLQLRPQALHLWTDLNSQFVVMKRFDLIPRIALRDPLAFKDEFKLLEPGELPPPEGDFKRTFEENVITGLSLEWLNQVLSQ